MSPSEAAVADRPTALDALRARSHENTVEAYRLFARTTPGGRITERPGLVLVDCCAADSMGNVAMVTGPGQDNAATLSQAEEFFARDHRPWMLLALPSAPPDLGAAARDRKFKDEGRFPGLLLDRIPVDIPPNPADVAVRRVDSLDELERFEHTASEAYEVEPGPVYASWLTYPGLSFHLVYYQGKPVATATLTASHGLAGIVYVGTIPSARGRGFGRAAVWAAIAAGREWDCTASALWATPMGRPMYERMGFRAITEYRIWTPPEFPLPRPFRAP